MESLRVTRSSSSLSVPYDQLKVKQVQDKITQQYQAAPRKQRQNSLRIAVLKKNYRKRLVEEINEKQKMKESAWYAAHNEVDKKSEISHNEPTKESGKLNGGRCLIKPSRFTTKDTKTSSNDDENSYSSPLRRTKSFNEKVKPVIQIRKSKLDNKPVPRPFFDLEKPVFDLSKPVKLRVPAIVSKIVPPTPTKQKPEQEPKARSNFGFSGRSLFQNGKPQKIPKMTENSSTFYISSEAALSHTAKINEIDEKMKYVRQLEKDFNDNKIKRQRDEEEDKEQKSKRRLSFGKNPLHFLVGAKHDE